MQHHAQPKLGQSRAAYAPWAGTMATQHHGLTLRRRPQVRIEHDGLHPARLQVHDARAGAHAHRPARHASPAAGARAGASE